MNQLPLKLSPSLTILNLGVVDHNRPSFRSSRHFYPIGFKSQRVYHSYINKSNTTVYTSEIRDGGNFPLFVVIAQDDPNTEHISSTPSSCWVEVIHKVKGRGTASGPEYFGFAEKTVRRLINELAEMNDKKRKFDQPETPDSPKEGPQESPPKRHKRSIESETDDIKDNSAAAVEQDKKATDLVEQVQESQPKSDCPDLPLQIGNGITLLNLGRVEHERSAFHSRLYIYTIGFKSQKRHFSYINPDQYTIYTSEVRDGGDSPLFVVTVEDDPGVEYVAMSPTSCWMEPANKVNRLRGTKTAISGPYFFGFTDEIAKALIEGLPGAIQCINYNRKGAATGKHGIAARLGKGTVTTGSSNRRGTNGLIVPTESRDKSCDDNETVTEEMAALRAMYELPYVFYLSTLLRKKLGLPCFTCRQLERLLINPNKVTRRLYLTVAETDDENEENWDEIEGWIPKTLEWDDISLFSRMDVSTRLKLLFRLFEWRTYSDRNLMAYLRKLDESVTRIDPIGADEGGNRYYHFGDERIYREDGMRKWTLVCCDSQIEISNLAITLQGENEQSLQKALKIIAGVTEYL